MGFWKWMARAFDADCKGCNYKPVEIPVDETPWYTLAKTQIGQKEIYGDKDNPKIIEYLMTTSYREPVMHDEIPWCFSEDVEILTDKGWKLFKNLKTEMVAQVSPVTHKISFVKPIKKIKKQYQGPGYHIKARNLDVICDNSHEWYGQFSNWKRKDGSVLFEKRTLDKMGDNFGIPAAETGIKENENYSKEYLEFLAAFISDGSFRYSSDKSKPWRVCFQVSKERKINELKLFGPEIVRVAPKAYGISTTPLTDFEFKVPKDYDKIFDDYKVPSWDFIFSLSKKQIDVFLNSYLIFDGSIKGASNIIYSSNVELNERLITLITLAGYHCYVTKNKSPFSGKDCYVLRWCKHKKTKTIKKQDIEEIQLNETLYCVQVPTGLILCRDKNKIPFITGNCAAFITWCLKYSNYAIPKERQALAATYSNYGTKLDKPKQGCIVTIKKEGADHISHVTFFDRIEGEYAVCLGGNQSNEVKYSKYLLKECHDFRWPVKKQPDTVLMGSLEWYKINYNKCTLRTEQEFKDRIAYSINKIKLNEQRYKDIAATLGYPWQLIASIHGLEAGFDFDRCFNNGEKIIGTGQKTTLVPKDRGPFNTWEESVIDSLGKSETTNWDIPTMLRYAESYNGHGYIRKGVMSPYLWACTNLYSKGKYVADGVYDSEAISKQVGVVAILKSLT